MDTYNSIYDTYDTSGTIDFFKLVNNDILQIFNTHNVDKTHTLSNIYTYKKYKAINEILYVIMFVTILILLLTIVNKNVKYFDTFAYDILVATIIIISFIYIIQLIYDILFRNNINYDEYEYEKPTNTYSYKNKYPKDYSEDDDDSKKNKCNKK